MSDGAATSNAGRPLAVALPAVVVGVALGAALAFALEGGIERRLDDLSRRVAELERPVTATRDAVTSLAARLDRADAVAQPGTAAASGRMGEECRAGRERLGEVENLLADAGAPSLVPWESARLLTAASGVLSAVEARVFRHGGCLAAEIADARDRITVGRIAARRIALQPVRTALADVESIEAALPAREALAGIATARNALARAETLTGQAEPDGEIRGLERRLDDVYLRWSREQQRRYDLWALERARALGDWAQRHISDIPLRGAGRAEIQAKLVEHLGPVEPRQLGPAVQAVHGELFQRLWRSLGEEQRVAAVAELVATPKRLPAEM
ncbi:MAG: hypothetical protein AB7P02_31305 [Alphaproteobacteria bacterium]